MSMPFWSAPTMTFGHLLFSVGCTGYILLGIFLEERDLIADFGDQYRDYRRKVGMLYTLPGRRHKPVTESAAVSERGWTFLERH